MQSIPELVEKPVHVHLRSPATIIGFHEKSQHGKNNAIVSREVRKTRFAVVQNASAWMEPSVLAETTRDQLPHPAFFRENDPWLLQFGDTPELGLNEIEYSANAFFRSVKLARNQRSDALYYMVRHYFSKKPITLCADEAARCMSTECASTMTRKLIWPAAVLRIDHRVTEDHPQSASDPSASAKFRMVRCKYFVEGVEVKLSCSTEIDLSQLASLPTKLAQSSSQWKNGFYIVYWYVILSGTSEGEEEQKTSYRFRVAFRSAGKATMTAKMSPVDFLERIAKPDNDKPVQCNIECEDEINGPLFLDCVKALFAYYKFQHDTAEEIEAELSPTAMASFAASEAGRGLTENQRALLPRMKVEHVGQDDDSQVCNPNPLLRDFVVNLCLKVWAKKMQCHVRS